MPSVRSARSMSCQEEQCQRTDELPVDDLGSPIMAEPRFLVYICGSDRGCGGLARSVNEVQPPDGDHDLVATVCEFGSDQCIRVCRCEEVPSNCPGG